MPTCGNNAAADAIIASLISRIFQDVHALTPLSPEVISRQATINIGTIGHVAHGKSTVVKAISGVQTVRFKNELERNITIKLGKFVCLLLFLRLQRVGFACYMSRIVLRSVLTAFTF